MILELAVVAQLAARCAHTVAPETMLAIVRTESGFAPLAIGVNPEPARGLPAASLRPDTAAEAVTTAAELLRQGRRVDLGLAQLSHANLPRLGMTLADAFEPCRNLAAGARILREGYAAALRTEADPQRALRVAFSRYNTGHPERGFANGYVVRVQGAAEVVVPAIRLRGEAAAAPQRLATDPAPEPPDDDPDAPPEWDVWARASHASRPRLVAVPHQTPATSGGAAGATLTDPPRTAE